MANISNFIEYNPCVICGSQNFKVLKKAKYDSNMDEKMLTELYKSSSDVKLLDQLVKCQKCNFVYLNPRIKSDIILDSYSNSADPIFFEQNDNRIKTFQKELKKFTRNCKINPSKTKVLDVGCAGGAFPKAAHDLGFEVTGIEPNKWLVAKGIEKYKLDLKAGVLSDFDFKNNSFDIVTLWDVIEHLTEPENVIKQISSLIKNDGYLLINYPDINSLACKLFRSNWPFYLNVHLFYFNRRTITKFLNQYGFKVVYTKPYWQTLELGYILKRASEYFHFFKAVGWFVKKVKVDKLPFKYNLGQTFLVAKKAAD